MTVHARGTVDAANVVATQRISDDDLTEIEEQFAEGGDGVWISPEFARQNQISAEDEERIEAAVAATEAADLRVLLVDVDFEDERFNGSYTQLVSWIQDDLGGEALYVGWSDYDQGIELHGADVVDDSFYVDRLAIREAPGDAAAQIEAASTLIDDGNAYELWSALDDDEKYGNPSGGGDGDSIGGAVIAVTVVVAAGLLLWGRASKKRHRANALARRNGEKFALPTTVLRTVRAAEDRSLRRQADSEIQTLGEKLVAQDLDHLEPGALQVWERAMEHHEVARRVLEQGSTPADVVGALVLVRRGEQARAAAIDGDTTWTPQPGCWFNPLHRGSTSTVTWTDVEGARRRSVDVPACSDCARAVRKGNEPDDVLDFVEGEKVVHYYRLDIGVWSRTGYGSLETDLVQALRSPQRRRGLRRS